MLAHQPPDPDATAADGAQRAGGSDNDGRTPRMHGVWDDGVWSEEDWTTETPPTEFGRGHRLGRRMAGRRSRSVGGTIVARGSGDRRSDSQRIIRYR